MIYISKEILEIIHRRIKYIWEEKIKEDYSVTPEQMIDIKALMGDASDCIPGVAGIGQKTAQDLVSRFGSIDEIYENLETLSGVRAAFLSVIDDLNREGERIFKVDASRSLEEISNEIFEIIKRVVE